MPASTPLQRFARRPLTTLDKLSLAGLLLSAFWCGLFALFPGARGGPLPYFFVGLLVCAGLVVAGPRWAPLLGALLSGAVAVSLFTLTGYVVFHLTQPKAQFAIFVIVLLFLVSVVATCAMTLYTAVRHYWLARPGDSRAESRWLVSALTGLVGLVLGAILIAAVAQPSAGALGTANGGEPAVHLGAASFTPALVAVPRGSKLLVVDDAAITHILANGSWNQNHAALELQSGAPPVNDVRVNGGTVEIGPFTTAGTFHILCLVHPGMNLTVVVP
jgi:plastocyanin